MFILYTWWNIALWLVNFAIIKVYNLEIYIYLSYFMDIDLFL
jgi:hypothetical protein